MCVNTKHVLKTYVYAVPGVIIPEVLKMSFVFNQSMYMMITDSNFIHVRRFPRVG